MMRPLALALRQLEAGLDLSPEETAAAFGEIMAGEASDSDIAALLLGLRRKGETADELSGAVRALRSVMISVPVADRSPLVDTCGTGGGRVGTMNVSTAAAFIATGAGVRVAKHGNRSFTSRCGSADVLEALGVRIDHDADEAARLLATVGLAFLFAPRYHPAMRHVAPVRRELKVTTIMNLVGPLSNPAGVRRQVVGVAEEGRLPLMAGALARLEVEHALVVYAKVGMDEISPAGLTRVMEVRGREIQEWVLDPAEFDLDWESTDELAGGEPAENAERIRRLFEGRGREADRRAVLLNAAAAVYVSGVVGSYGDAVALAVEALASGRPRQVLGELSGEG